MGAHPLHRRGRLRGFRILASGAGVGRRADITLFFRGKARIRRKPGEDAGRQLLARSDAPCCDTLAKRNRRKGPLSSFQARLRVCFQILYTLLENSTPWMLHTSAKIYGAESVGAMESHRT